MLVLGLGVTLRMQLEQPGIETSAPSSSASEYPVAPSEAPAADATAPAPAPAQAPQSRQQAEAIVAPAPAPAKPAARLAEKRREARAPEPRAKEAERDLARAEPNPFADGPVAMQQAPNAPAPPAVSGYAAPAPPAATAAAPAMEGRARNELAATDSARGARALRKLSIAPDPDPARELERIAKLREAGQHEEADRALEAFHRKHPGYDIPAAMRERIKAR